jgi:hypothetical protein
MNYFGILTGLVTLLIIGLGFPLVIYGERIFGHLWWPYMMGTGIIIILASLFIASDWGSVILAVLGATVVWGSTELKEQAVRTEVGWYPFNAGKLKPPLESSIRKWKAPHL